MLFDPRFVYNKSNMSVISLEEVYKLARLARIELNEQTAKRMQQELSAILSFVEQLDQVDTAGIEPTYQVTGLMNVTREDELIDYGVTPEALLANAPAQRDGTIEVKRVL